MVVLPRKIYLTAINQHWKVSYTHTPGQLKLIELPHRKLLIQGRRYSKKAAIEIVNKWVKLKSKTYLTSSVSKINQKIHAKFKKLNIHSLKTEWGSFSAKKVLGLNYQLIFLPPNIVRHIIIHELCHVHYFSHSPKFWQMLAKFDKRWKKNKKGIELAANHVPEWLIF